MQKKKRDKKEDFSTSCGNVRFAYCLEGVKSTFTQYAGNEVVQQSLTLGVQKTGNLLYIKPQLGLFPKFFHDPTWCTNTGNRVSICNFNNLGPSLCQCLTWLDHSTFLRLSSSLSPRGIPTRF